MNKPLTPAKSAMQQDRQVCLVCNMDSSITENPKECPYCHTRITPRIKYSQQKTWALLLTAMIFIIPANFYPITYLYKNGVVYPETIFSGILTLIRSKQEGIAVIVFVASIVVPIFKILALGFISLAVHLKWQLTPKKQFIAFSVVEWVGRWSILDLFVISIIMAVFDKGNLVSVDPGMAATSFTIVVITTLFAAESFDTRLIWDANHDAR